MRKILLTGVAFGLSCLVASAAGAQTTAPTTEPTAPAAAPVEAAPVAAAPTVVPKGTPIVVEIVDLVSSKTAKQTDMFNLKLAEPVKLNDVIVIPAGTPGKGEVIDAARPGMAGKSGKLVLSARYLELDGKQIPIRGLKLNVRGKDNTDVATATTMAIGMFGLLVTGGDMEVPAGTQASAKLGADFTPGAAADAAAAPQTNTAPAATPPADAAPAPAAAAQNSQ